MIALIKTSADLHTPYYLWIIPVILLIIAIIVIITVKRTVDKKNQEREEYERNIKKELEDDSF